MYLDFKVKIPSNVAGITRKKIKGVTYIYYAYERNYILTALVNKFWTRISKKLFSYIVRLHKPYDTLDIAPRNAGQLSPTV